MTEVTLFVAIAILVTLQCAGFSGLIAALLIRRGPPGPQGAMGPSGLMGESCQCVQGSEAPRVGGCSSEDMAPCEYHGDPRTDE